MKGAMGLAMRVVCNQVGDGNGGKSDGDDGCGRASTTRKMAMATAMTWAMGTATRVAGNEKGNHKGGKGNGIGNKGGV